MINEFDRKLEKMYGQQTMKKIGMAANLKMNRSGA